jgi:hypothetical protein
MGPELMDNMRKQAERFGTQFIFDHVESVDFKGKLKNQAGRPRTFGPVGDHRPGPPQAAWNRFGEKAHGSGFPPAPPATGPFSRVPI